ATPTEIEQVAATFAEQAAALVEGGVDLFVLETFRHLEEIRIAIEAARRAASGLPIIASMAFNASETAADGSTPEQIATMLRDWGADVLGVNCGDGPQLALVVAERMRRAGVPLCVQPNAGLPRTVDGRLLYMATPEYFDIFARRTIQLGATMVGGCCGTTPEHVHWMAKSGRMLTDRHVEVVRPSAARPAEVVPVLAPIPMAERSDFAAKIAAGTFVVSVEVNPAPGLDPSKALEGAKMLLASGVDIVNVADAPRAMARMSNLAFCSLLLERYGIQPILHVCGRDRNLLGQMAHLLGAHAIGIRNLVIITGDPPKVGDYPEATAVYDLDAIGLLQMASNMNRGVDPAGKPLPGGQTSFLLATGLEPGAADLDKELAPPEEKRGGGGGAGKGARPPREEAGGRRGAHHDAADLPDGPARDGAAAHRAPGDAGAGRRAPAGELQECRVPSQRSPRHADPRSDPRADAQDAGRRGRAQGRRQDRARDAVRRARARPGCVSDAAARPLRAGAGGAGRPEAIMARCLSRWARVKRAGTGRAGGLTTEARTARGRPASRPPFLMERRDQTTSHSRRIRLFAFQ